MILITGATGNNGREILRRLSGRGLPIRAMVRKPNTWIEAMPDVNCVVADFDNETSLQKAIAGVDRAFLVTNSSERVEEQQTRFVRAAQTAGVKHIVYLSQLHASADSPLRFLRYHAAIEDALHSSGMAWTSLRPNLYMQGLLMIGKSIASEGRFYAPAVDCRVSVVDVRDIADAAVSALTEDGHSGKVYNLTGPQALTFTEMASLLTQALGKPVSYVDIPEGAMRAALGKSGMPEWQADGLIEDFAHYRRNEATEISTGVEKVTGHLPTSFEHFARDFREGFLRPAQKGD
jgi:uncharacterized protein YbjT (DUF2867 family)